MIVHEGTLDVVPAADELIADVAGELTDEYDNGEVAWNNELALHVVEFKFAAPRRSLAGASEAFAANVALANESLRKVDRLLLGGAMHPWMDPAGVKLWPYGLRDVYETFDRIFSCKGHGWANLQSAHINLPFSDDEEFARLHSAIRFVLPILPALAASSPVIDGARNGVADNRLLVYRTNCAKVPALTGDVVPEPIGSIGEYHESLLARLYRDLAPHDPEGVLRHEWVNARGAIARFSRMAIEIRVLDVQEAPCMDVAYAALIVEVLKLVCAEEWASVRSLDARPTAELARLFELAARRGEGAAINDRAYLHALGLRRTAATAWQLWEHLADAAAAKGTLELGAARALEHYLRHGTLATRIGKAAGVFPDRDKLREVYGQLSESLAANAPFTPVPAPRR